MLQRTCFNGIVRFFIPADFNRRCSRLLSSIDLARVRTRRNSLMAVIGRPKHVEGEESLRGHRENAAYRVWLTEPLMKSATGAP